jgi:hypothetical protein
MEREKKLKTRFENVLVRPKPSNVIPLSSNVGVEEGEAEKGETDEMIVNSSVYQNRKCSREEKSAAMWWVEKAEKRNERSRTGTE